LVSLDGADKLRGANARSPVTLSRPAGASS